MCIFYDAVLMVLVTMNVSRSVHQQTPEKNDDKRAVVHHYHKPTLLKQVKRVLCVKRP